MAMQPCSVCKGMDWTYVHDDKTNRVTATCGDCNRSVSFLTKKGKKIAAGWTPAALTTGTHAPDYVPIDYRNDPLYDPENLPW